MYRSASDAFGTSPKERGTAEVNQRAVHQLVRLALDLQVICFRHHSCDSSPAITELRSRMSRANQLGSWDMWSASQFALRSSQISLEQGDSGESITVKKMVSRKSAFGSQEDPIQTLERPPPPPPPSMNPDDFRARKLIDWPKFETRRAEELEPTRAPQPQQPQRRDPKPQ